ncbi:ECF-type sigma factor [Planctomycetota bacterium]
MTGWRPFEKDVSMSSHSTNVTQLLSGVSTGKADAVDSLMSLLYDELRAMAHHIHAQQLANDSLQPTALLHEAYLKLVKDRDATPDDRTHFFNVAALAMRQVITDHARKRRSAKRGGEWSRVDLGTIRAGSSVIDVDVMALDDALTRLAELNERQSRIVEMRSLPSTRTVSAATVATIARWLEPCASRTIHRSNRWSRCPNGDCSGSRCATRWIRGAILWRVTPNSFVGRSNTQHRIRSL